MSLVSKTLRGIALVTAHTIARPLLDKDDMAWIKKQAAQERAEEAAAAVKAKAQRKLNARG